MTGGGGGVVAARSPRTAWLAITAALSLLGVVGAVILAPGGASAEPAEDVLAGAGLTALLFVGSSMHVASSAWFLSRPEVRAEAGARRGRFVVAPLALIAGATTAAAVMSPATFVWVLPVFFAWQFFHFQRQNLGVVALAASSNGSPPLTDVERWSITAAGVAGIGALLARPALLGLSIDLRLTWSFPLWAVVTVGSSIIGLAAAARCPAPGGRRLEHLVLMAAALAFFVPVFVFANPYAAASGLVLAHGFQYLAIMACVAAGEADPARRITSLAVLVNVALAGGLVLLVFSHQHGGGPGVRALYGAFLGLTMAHFVVDAALWRLRDEFPRAFLHDRVPYLVRGR